MFFALFLLRLLIFIKKNQRIMKMIKVKQLSVEVGKCKVYSLPFLEYSLKISINRQLYAATSFKPKQGEQVDFGTRLFLRMDNPLLQQITKCSVQVTGQDGKGNKRQIGFAEVNTKQEGMQVTELQVLGNFGCKMTVQLQFAQSVVEVKQSKSINNKLNSNKSQISQKQSSCEQKQSLSSKTTNYFSSTPLLDNYDPQNVSVAQGCVLKTSNSEKLLCNKSEQLQTSAATARGELKDTQPNFKGEDSQTLISLQIKIDQLQQKLNEVNSKLSQCTIKLEQALQKVIQEKKRSRVIEEEKEELMELLTLEELRNKMAMSHIAKLNAFVDQVKKNQGGEIEYIQEKDQIVMINQELELQLANKNLIISQLQQELDKTKIKFAQLEEKLQRMEVKPNFVIAQTPKKIPYVPSKELEKVKSQKKILDKNSANWNKKQQDNAKETTKQTNSTKEQPKTQSKEVQRKKIKKEPEITKIPPPRQSKELKAPILPQGKTIRTKSTKNLKPEIKNEEKKSSHIQSSLPSLAIDSQGGNQPNLLLNSRALQSLSKHPSLLKNSVQ